MNDIEPIVRDVTLAAPPEALFDAFTDPEHLTKWFAQEVNIDLSPDGAWRFDWPGGMAAEGHVRQADRPSHYIWTWEKSVTGEQAMDSMVVIDYTFTAEGDGTLMHIEESGHETAEMRDTNAEGLEGMLVPLRAYVEDGTEVDWTVPPPE